MKAPTERQRVVLDFIKREVMANGQMPTYRAIGGAIGISRTRVSQLLEGLANSGHLIRVGKYVTAPFRLPGWHPTACPHCNGTGYAPGNGGA